MNIKVIIKKMTFEQKAFMLTGNRITPSWYEEFGISRVRMVDGPNGVRAPQDSIEGGCICFPCSSAIGASWSKDVAFRVGAAIAKDCNKLDIDVLLAPGVNMKRTPHCGRNFEYFSEDPVLSGEMGAEFVNGLKSEGVGACVKHFAANNQEFERMHINADVDERTLHEYYLRVFEILLMNCSPTSIMCAYNKLNGVHCSENKYILTDILRKMWGYDGIVISDWGAVHNIAKCVSAGLDLEMPTNNNIIEELKKGINAGLVTMEQIDTAVERMLKFVFDIKVNKHEKSEYSRTNQHKEAQKLAGECITLLKNADDILPITNKKYKKILVVGRLAEVPLIQGSGAAKINLKDEAVDLPLDYIKQYALKTNIEVEYDMVYEQGYMGAEQIAHLNSIKPDDYDAIIVFLGDNYGADTETEHWDRDNIIFTNYMNGMANAASNGCENVIVVMQTGSATIPVRWNKTAKGIIQMWYAGEGGGKAVADVLFGKINPSGKLSETFITKARDDIDYVGDGYKAWYREGLFVGYRYYDEHPENVWFPFGHGLSYTTFKYSDIKLDSYYSDNPDNTVKVSFKVKNTGNHDGKEVVQLYVGEKNAVVTRPVKELKKFNKIDLKAGEDKTVEFTLGKSDFAYFNQCLHEWHVESGKYDILVGASSADIRLKAIYEIQYKNDYSNGGRKSEFTMA